MKIITCYSIAVLLAAASAHAITPTLIESAGGKRLLFVYEKEIESEATGKIVLHIDGDNLLTNIHDPAVLVIDGNTVRHTPAGVVLASIDDDDIRHGRGGKVVMNYRHPDLCPDAHSNRVFRVDGPPLTRPQLIGVLYTLKPELFALSAEETAAQQKEMADNGAEADRQAAADHVADRWDVLNGSGPAPKIGQGTITFGGKKGEVYPAAFDYSKGGGPLWTGVAIAGGEMSGEQPLWVAYGTPKTIGLCVYDVDEGALSGKWYPWYGDGSAKNVGTENLSGPAGLDGEYKIVSAKAPATGTAYAGTVLIKPLKIVGASKGSQPYGFTWTLGAYKIYGIGILSGKRLYVASGAGPDLLVAKFGIHNGSFAGDYYKFGSTEMGSMAASGSQ